jgi:tRNA(His) 5'-end guanylyltransferase
MDKTSLGDRMKRYESVSKTELMRRTPVILRIDGKAFHTYTKQPEINTGDPFSQRLQSVFREAAIWTIKNIQGAKFAFLQSDEVSFLLTDWKKINTDAWFKYGVQKMCSVAASLFTYYFNREAMYAGFDAEKVPAFFDARVFNLPAAEVVNYFIWRQQDATRNSIQMLARSEFSHKELNGKNSSQIQDMLLSKRGINWNDTPTHFKRGSCVVSQYEGERQVFDFDYDIPIFTQDRDYIDKYLKVNF